MRRPGGNLRGGCDRPTFPRHPLADFRPDFENVRAVMIRPSSCLPRGFMTLALVTSITAACHRSASAPAPVAAPDTAAVMRDVRYMASDALEGRGTGTAGNDSAAAYIARRFASLGLTPVFDTVGNRICRTPRVCDARFVQPFIARSVAAAHAGLPGELPTQNVVALV